MGSLVIVAHVVLGTLAFGFVILFDFVLVAIAKTRDVRTIRTAFATAFRYARWVGVLLGLAVVLGLIQARTLHVPLTSGWLVASYVLVVLAGALGIGATFRRHGRILEAAFRSPIEQPSPELEQAIAGAQPIGAYVMIVLMAALVYVMFVKPFG